MSYYVGIDAGGTFTDLVALNEAGQILVHKLPSNPEQPAEVLLDGLAGLANSAGLALDSLLADCAVIIHGSTVALNTLIKRSGAKTALVATAGHEDSIEIRLGHKEDGHRWDFRYPAAEPLVPAQFRIGARERVRADGNVHQELDEQRLRQDLADLAEQGIGAIAISCLWSFLYPQHERRIAALVEEYLPGCYVSSSLDVLPRVGEYTRTSTTVANAYVGPVMRQYVADLESAINARGFTGQFYIMQSNGGVATPSVLMERPVASLNSGPAAGPVAALWFAQKLGSNNVISIDMGGTSFDICLVKDGLPDVINNTEVARVRIGLPMVNVTSIGAGGGSIARIDERGLLQVGPDSAEAYPGPACYGRGGERATVTDACVVAGFLPDTGLLGGAMNIDRGLAADVIRRDVAQPAGIDLYAAARGIIEVTARNMVEGIRIASIERGHDPRDYVLVAGGGAGPVFAGLLARELGITQVLIPRIAGALCALGEASANLRYDAVRAFPTTLGALDPNRLRELFAEMEREGAKALDSAVADGEHSVRIERIAEMKYVDQIHYCDVAIPPGPLDVLNLASLRDRFHARHHELYTYSEHDNEPEILSIRISTIAERSSRFVDENVDRAVSPTTVKASTERDMVLPGLSRPVPVPVYAGSSLGAGAHIVGPAVIEEQTTTIVVLPNDELTTSAQGFYLLKVVPRSLQ